MSTKSPSSAAAQVPPTQREARQRLQQAIAAHRAGDLLNAERLYRPLAAVAAVRADALHYLGVLMHQRGRTDAGVTFVRQALMLEPGHADAHNNLGNILKESGDLAQAEQSYRSAIAIDPCHAQALGNLAVMLETRAAIPEARSIYLQWRLAQPADARAHYLFGRFLCAHPEGPQDIEAGVDAFRTSLSIDPDHAGALEAMGMALYSLDRIDEATDVYRRWTNRDPSHPVPRHMLAACGGHAVPERADDAYIRHVFDRFAAGFDAQLVGNLAYRAPEALVAAIDALTMPADLDVLDAGCGTGLCGPLLRDRARWLTGIDLSPVMIEKATQRQCYDELLVAEVIRHLEDASRYDLIVSADTLVYFGPLRGFFDAAYVALRAGGQLAFTLEALADESPHRLMPSGRYRHSAAYVSQSLSDAGFDQIDIAPDRLRREAGQWVEGWVVTARRMLPGEH